MKNSQQLNTDTIKIPSEVSITRQDVDNIIQKLKAKIEEKQESFVQSQVKRIDSINQSDSVNITFPKNNQILKKKNGEVFGSTNLSFIATVEEGKSKNESGYEENKDVNSKQNPYFLIKVSDEYSIKFLGKLPSADSATLSLVDVKTSLPNIKGIFESVFKEVVGEKIEQAEQAKLKEQAEQKAREKKEKAQKAFTDAQKSFEKANESLKEKLTSFNKDGKNVGDLLKSVKQVQDQFKTLEREAGKAGLENKISTELKDQKLYVDFLEKNLKPEGQDQQSFMKDLSGQFYKPYERLLNILNKSNNITGKEDLIKKLKENKDKGFALSGQIESNLKTFFTRLERKIQENKDQPKSLPQYCQEVSLTLNGDTGTGKTMFIESLLGLKDEKNKYFTNQKEKDSLGALGNILYGDKAEKIFIHCKDFTKKQEEIEGKIREAKQGSIIAFDETNLLTKEQKEKIKSLSAGKIKITAIPKDGVQKVLKRDGEDRVEKEKLVSQKEDRKNKVLANVVSRKDAGKLELGKEYCLSIIDAEGSILSGPENMVESNDNSYDFGDIFNKNLEGINFNNEHKPQVIICPPGKDGKNVIYTLKDEKYEKKEVNKNDLKTQLDGKKRVFQVFGPSNQEEAENSRGNIDGGDYGTSLIKNPKILFYSFDVKIREGLEELVKKDSNSLDNKGKATLVNLINKYDEFIVQAYGRARADTADIIFHNPEAKKLHEQIQAKKTDLLKDDLFKTEIDGKSILVDYNSFVERFNKNLPQEERGKIISQAFLKVISEEKPDLPKVAIDAMGDEKRFKEACNIIKSLSKEQREVLIEIGKYDDAKLLDQQKTALAIIQASIKAEIEAKRAIYDINAQNYSDFRSENKIEEKTLIKIASDGKVSLEGVDGVIEGKFESKKYFNNSQGEGTKLNEADANAFKGHIEDHFKENNKKILEEAKNKYSELVKSLQGLDLTEEGKKEKEGVEQDLRECLKLTTKLNPSEINEFIKGLNDNANLSKLEEKLVDLQSQNKELQEENDKKIQDLKKQNNDLMQESITNNAAKEDQIKKLQQKKETLEAENSKIKTLIVEAVKEEERIVLKNAELKEKIEKQQSEITEYEKEKTLLQQVSETAQQAVEDLKTQLASVLGLSNEKDNNLKELEEKIKKLQEQQAQQQLETQQKLEQQIKDLELAKNAELQVQALQNELKQKEQEIIQMQEQQLQKPVVQNIEVQTTSAIETEVDAKIAEITKNKSLDSNIDALFNGDNLKELYHTADSFDKIGQANLGVKYDEDCYMVDGYRLDFEDSEEGDKIQFNLLRKSIIQSSAIRDKHLNLQEVLQEDLQKKGLVMSDALKAYSFKSLDQLIDGDNFKNEFKADLKRLGFGTGEDGIWTKGEGENAVTYDTNQPYVKDFLINAYYEENFKQFEKALNTSLTNDKSPTLDELKNSAVERYNAKQKLEFVDQIVNYQAVATHHNQQTCKKDFDEKQLNDYVEIANIINNKNKTYEERFKSENEAIKELEKKIVRKETSMKIEVGASASLLVNPNILKVKSEQEEDVPDDEVDHPNKVNSSKQSVFLLKLNQGLLHMIGEHISKLSDEFNDLTSESNSNPTNETLSSQIPHSIIKPNGLENLLQESLRSSYESIRGFFTTQSTDPDNNSNLPDDQNNQNHQKQQ